MSEVPDNGSDCRPVAPEPVVVPTRGIAPARLDPDALKVVRRLRRFGHSAYLVGGCVRDLLLRRQPKDFDVATSARPNEIRKLFRNCRLIGRRFRLAHIIFRDKIIETATFRADVPNHSPDLLIRSDNVFGSEEQDARRRDFSVNALFYDPLERVLVDYVGGLEDLAQKSLRLIGDPQVRVQEDPVRILRALRFSARLGFAIEPCSYQAMIDHREKLRLCAPPRLLEEIMRILRSGAARRAFEMLWQSGVLEVLLPELQQFLQRAPERGEEREPGAGLFACLGALDSADRELLSNPVLLAAVVLHPVADMVEHGSACYGLAGNSRAPGELARLLLRGLVQRLALPRWQAERVQQLLAGLYRLLALPPRARLPRALMRRAYFPETLDLMSCTVRASGQGRRQLERLRRALRKRPQRQEDEAGASAGGGDKPPARKPRRRRRRRRPRPAE